MSDLRVPDVLGEIVGWRAWRVIGTPKFPMLASVTHGNFVWQPNAWTIADCHGEYSCRRSLDGHSPGERCSCGMYAAKDRKQLVDLGYNRYAGDQVVFIGEVGFTGKVAPGTQGYRAERGRIRRLYVPWEHFEYVEGLERLYGCEVLLDNTFNAVSIDAATIENNRRSN